MFLSGSSGHKTSFQKAVVRLYSAVKFDVEIVALAPMSKYLSSFELSIGQVGVSYKFWGLGLPVFANCVQADVMKSLTAQSSSATRGESPSIELNR